MNRDRIQYQTYRKARVYPDRPNNKHRLSHETIASGVTVYAHARSPSPTIAVGHRVLARGELVDEMGAKGCKIPRRWHEKFGGLEDQDVSEAFKHNYKEMRWEMSRILEDQERPETPKPCYEDKQRPPSHGPRTTGRVTLSQKVFVPIKHRPNFNFVGHILGPKGSKIRQLEQKTRCRIWLWGMGSPRNRNKGD